MFVFAVLQHESGEGNGTPLQYSCLENPMDGGAWWATAHGVTKSWTQLSNFTLTFHFYALEKEMATHSSVLAWRIPGTEEPCGLPSMASHRVGHGQSDLAAAAAVWISQKYTWISSVLSLPPCPPVQPLQVFPEHWTEPLRPAAASHELSALYMVVFICQSCSPGSAHPPQPCVHTSVLSVCISVLAPEVASSVLFF